VELSPHPEWALKVTEKLPSFVPDSGHLHHMPTHIYVQLGDYERSVSHNLEGVIRDKAYVEYAGIDCFYTLYLIHNYHFLLYGAMFDGQSQLAISTGREMAALIKGDYLDKMLDWVEGFIPMTYHALVRFGKWEEIINEPLPSDTEKYCCTLAIAYYARTVALATLNRIDEAETERKKFLDAVAKVPKSRRIFVTHYRDILGVAELMLNGELEYRKKNYKEAFDYLRKAVDTELKLPYDEPWAWMQPARHALGALLLEQKRVDEAEKEYRADLKDHPKNMWALQGLEECLRIKGKNEEADEILAQLNKAKERSDVKVKSSCYCRRNV